MARMFLIDGSNHAFRVQFALPPMNAADGFPTRALYGFTTLFAKILRTHQPDYCAVAFDKGKTFRHDMYPEYKGHRPDMPEDLRLQWPHFQKLVEAFGYPYLQIDGFEADDVIGTIAKTYASPDLHVYLVTGDKDYAQLVDDNITMLDLMKNAELGPAEVVEKFGVSPEQVVDILGLSGDKSDNIPGIPGIGPKKALQYLLKYGSFDAVLAHHADIGGKTGERIAEHAANARLSRDLATIRTAVPLSFTLDDLAPKGMQPQARELFDQWSFGKVAQRLLPDEPAVEPTKYRAITTQAELETLVAELRAAKRFAFDLESTSLDPRKAEIVGMSFSTGPTDGVYLPLRHKHEQPLDPEAALALVGPLLADRRVGKIGQNLKYDLEVCRESGLQLNGIVGDTMLLDYVLAAHERSHGLDKLAQRHLGHTMISYSEVSQGETRTFDEVSIEEATRYAAEDAHICWMLHDKLAPRLEAGQREVYEKIEVPLIPVLADMELTGIKVDLDRLAEIRSDISERALAAEAACHQAAGREFAVNSRHELRDILFEELALPPGKKVKDGWSTDSSVLDKIKHLHPLPGLILEYRRLQKLESTYLSALPGYVADDGRIHSSFNQAVAASGRLSSNEPNLQNIPIRTADGRRIREAFVPSPGYRFLSADYSQVELRVLAHFCGEGALVDWFRAGEDIHRRTASEIFGVDLAAVTSEQRSAAKAINFGLVYGMSAFRLAGDLCISRGEAQQYMDDYFGRMPQVKAWLEATREEAKVTGWVETLYGRRRIIPNLHSRQFNLAAQAEREAVNTRVQGTAADIIKRAMLRVDGVLKREGFGARMLLQVHDELLLEVPEDELGPVTEWVVEAMEGAARLAVPLVVNYAIGDNWNEAHG